VACSVRKMSEEEPGAAAVFESAAAAAACHSDTTDEPSPASIEAQVRDVLLTVVDLVPAASDATPIPSNRPAISEAAAPVAAPLQRSVSSAAKKGFGALLRASKSGELEQVAATIPSDLQESAVISSLEPAPAPSSASESGAASEALAGITLPAHFDVPVEIDAGASASGHAGEWRASATEQDVEGVVKSPRKRAAALDIDVGIDLSEDHEQLVEEARLLLAMIDGHHLAYWQSRYDDELTRVEMMQAAGGGAAVGALFTWCAQSNCYTLTLSDARQVRARVCSSHTGTHVTLPLPHRRP
jgi:hypothetical protein